MTSGKRAAVVVVALGSLLLLAAFLLFDRTRAPDPRVPLSEPEAAAVMVPLPERPSSESMPASTRPISAKPFLEADAQARAEPVSVRVLVLDARGYPVPGADVAWRDQRDGDWLISVFAERASQAGFERAPHKTVADARGVAVVEDAIGWLTVFARQGELLGFRYFAAAPRAEVRVTIAPVRSSRDAREHEPPPQVGRVVLKLFDPEGRPLAEAAAATLQTSSLQPVMTVRGENGRCAKSVFGSFHSTNRQQGAVEFRHAVANVPLKVSVTCASFDSVSDHEIGSVPENGELVAEIRFRRKQALLVGRVIDESGRSVAEHALALEIVMPEGFPCLPKEIQVRTDGAGVFRQGIDRAAVKKDGCDLALARCRDGIVERMGFVSFPRFGEAEETRDAVVKLAPPEAMVFGSVVDEEGAPLAGVSIMSHVQTGETSFVIGGRSSFVDGRITRSDARGNYLVPLAPRLRSMTYLFGLQASLDGYVCQNPLNDTLPTLTPVRLVMRATGSISGAMRLPDSAPIGKLEIRVVLTEPKQEFGQSIRRFDDCVDSDGAFLVSGVVPGTATLSVMLRDVAEPLVEIADVEVPRLGITDDARLRQIDLRDHPALKR